MEGHNGTFTAEPRPHKDWLGESWFRDLDICVKFARQHNLTMVIYDDWWWPSQMMGGRVPPQYGSKRLKASATSVEGPQKLRAAGQGDAHLVALVAGKETADGRIDGASLVNVASFLNQGTLAWDVPQGKWRIMKFTWEFNGNRGGQQRYISVDGASPECVDWFIKTVYQPHYDRFKEDFGKTIVGYFYDEPETQGDWGTDLPRLIAERGLDLNKLLVAYQFQAGRRGTNRRLLRLPGLLRRIVGPDHVRRHEPLVPPTQGRIPWPFHGAQRRHVQPGPVRRQHDATPEIQRHGRHRSGVRPGVPRPTQAGRLRDAPHCQLDRPHLQQGQRSGLLRGLRRLQSELDLSGNALADRLAPGAQASITWCRTPSIRGRRTTAIFRPISTTAVTNRAGLCTASGPTTPIA